MFIILLICIFFAGYTPGARKSALLIKLKITYDSIFMNVFWFLSTWLIDSSTDPWINKMKILGPVSILNLLIKIVQNFCLVVIKISISIIEILINWAFMSKWLNYLWIFFFWFYRVGSHTVAPYQRHFLTF